MVAAVSSKFPIINGVVDQESIIRVESLNISHAAKLLVNDRGDFSSMPRMFSVYILINYKHWKVFITVKNRFLLFSGTFCYQQNLKGLIFGSIRLFTNPLLMKLDYLS
jgi:hypothetical protein